jgi:hypothetical protein
MRRIHLVAPIPLCILMVACGQPSAGAPASTTDVLAGRSPADIIAAAQGLMRTANYHFASSVQQSSKSGPLKGMPAGFVAAANAGMSATVDGVVAGLNQVQATAHFDSVPGDVHLVESGCNGYISLDGSTWSTSSDARWVTRMVQPTFDDAMRSLPWRDLGATTLDGTPVHHLQATLNWIALRAAQPSPNATPDPGVEVTPAPVDVWVRSADGLPAKVTETLDTSLNLALAAPKDIAPSVSGIVRQHLVVASTYTPSQYTVTTPALTPGAPPVPAAIIRGFGLFGVQKDACDTPLGSGA